MRATYRGDPNDERDRTEGATFAGIWFPRDEAIDVPDTLTEAQRRKLANHNHFIVDSGPVASETPKDAPAVAAELPVLVLTPETEQANDETAAPKPKGRKKKEA